MPGCQSTKHDKQDDLGQTLTQLSAQPSQILQCSHHIVELIAEPFWAEFIAEPFWAHGPRQKTRLEAHLARRRVKVPEAMWEAGQSRFDFQKTRGVSERGEEENPQPCFSFLACSANVNFMCLRSGLGAVPAGVSKTDRNSPAKGNSAALGEATNTWACSSLAVKGRRAPG